MLTRAPTDLEQGRSEREVKAQVGGADTGVGDSHLRRRAVPRSQAEGHGVREWCAQVTVGREQAVRAEGGR